MEQLCFKSEGGILLGKPESPLEEWAQKDDNP